MMTLIMGGRSTQTVARACELGVAMQLTNIARDVGEDARRGRLYLPLAWCREAGLDPEEFLENPQPSEAVMVVIKRVLKVAEQLYVRAETGIAALPRDCRAAIMAARLIYADIGRVILARGCNAITQRAVVSDQRKWWLMARAMGSYLIAPQRDYLLTPLSEIQFLVTAVPSPEHDPARVDAFYPVVAMLERIGQLERDQRASSPRA
jgi:phytoene synthase